MSDYDLNNVHWSRFLVSSTSNNTNVRQGPGVEFPIIERIYKEEIVKSDPDCSQGDWWPVIKGGKTGWVHSGYVDFKSAPVRSPYQKVPQFEAAPIVDMEALKRLAFDITSVWEGGGYALYQTYDAGVVSYGRFQFTLASGNLFKVVERFTQTSSSFEAGVLKEYLNRVRDRDALLARSDQFRAVLISAASTPEMQAVQDQIASEVFWDFAVQNSIIPRNLKYPLSYVVIFDMAINHGLNHDMLTSVERSLVLPEKTCLPDDGVNEFDFIYNVALLRQKRMHEFADKKRLYGLKPRVDFFVQLIESGRWNLEGVIQIKSKNTSVQGMPSPVPVTEPKAPCQVEVVSPEAVGPSLYSLPKTSYEKIGFLKPNDVFPVVGKHDEWLLIQLDRCKAWIEGSDSIRVVGSCDVPTLNPWKSNFEENKLLLIEVEMNRVLLEGQQLVLKNTLETIAQYLLGVDLPKNDKAQEAEEDARRFSKAGLQNLLSFLRKR